ncbi:MAG: hypothetical protein AAFV95_22045 [Bacteroidota bacterium]
MLRSFHFLAFCLLFFLSSCSSTTEEVWINPDGSGRSKTSSDMSAMLPFLTMAMQQEDQEKGESPAEGDQEANPLDFLNDVLKEGRAIDTILTFDSFVEEEMKKDNITKEELMEHLAEEDGEEAKMAKKLMDEITGVQIRLQLDPSKDLFNMSFTQPFKHIDSTLNSTLADMMQMSDPGNRTNQSPSQVDQFDAFMGGMAEYELKKKCLIVKRKPVDLSKMEGEEAEAVGMMQSFMKDSKYTMVIHLPGKVRKVDHPDATFEGNTVRLEFPFLDMYDPEKNLEMEIKFKPNKKIRY